MWLTRWALQLKDAVLLRCIMLKQQQQQTRLHLMQKRVMYSSPPQQGQVRAMHMRTRTSKPRYVPVCVTRLTAMMACLFAVLCLKGARDFCTLRRAGGTKAATCCSNNTDTGRRLRIV